MVNLISFYQHYQQYPSPTSTLQQWHVVNTCLIIRQPQLGHFFRHEFFNHFFWCIIMHMFNNMYYHHHHIHGMAISIPFPTPNSCIIIKIFQYSISPLQQVLTSLVTMLLFTTINHHHHIHFGGCFMRNKIFDHSGDHLSHRGIKWGPGRQQIFFCLLPGTFFSKGVLGENVRSPWDTPLPPGEGVVSGGDDLFLGERERERPFGLGGPP